MARAVIYTRISKDRTGERAGVDRQLADCEKLCTQRGWEVVERISDNDRSAYSGQERPGYEQLLDLITGGQVDVVVAWHSDRLWRSVLDQQLFLAAGRDASLHLVATPSGEFDPADGDDEFTSTLMAAVARKESADKSRRLRRKHAEIAERGGFGGGPRVFGYTPRRDGIVEDEADELRAAIDRILVGEPPAAVAADWNDREVTTPNGHRWDESILRRVLTAARYAGLRVRHGEIVGAAQWEPIIDVDTHERIVAFYRRRQAGPRKAPLRRYLLTGLLRCGKCGAGLNGGVLSGRPVYICPPATRGGCSGITIRADLAEATVRDMAAAALDSTRFAERVARATDDIVDHDTRQAYLAKQLGADRARLTELAELWADGDLDRSEWRTARERITARIETAERELTAAAGDVALLGAPVGGDLVQRWDAMTVHHQRALLELLLDEVTVMPAGSQIGKPRRWFDIDRLRPSWRS